MTIKALILSLSLTTTMAVADSSFYRQGADAFRAGDYDQALEFFVRQQEQGDQRAVLTYNIGACYYRLGQYREAAVHFRSLISDPQWQDLGRYNLALSERRLGHLSSAHDLLTRVSKEAGDQRLRQLARTELNSLTQEQAQLANASGQYLLLSAAAGYDSNPWGLNDSLSATDLDDSYTDLLLDAGRTLNPGADNPLNGGVTLFARSYSEFSELDWRSISAGVDYQQQNSTRWQPGIGAFASYAMFGGDPYMATASVRLSLLHTHGDQEVRLRYEPGITMGLDGNDGLDGMQNRFSLRWQLKHGAGWYRLGYRYDSQAQDQQPDDPLTAGLARSRQEINAAMLRPLGAQWAWRLNGYLTRTAYDDESSVTNADGSISTDYRRTTTLGSGISLRYRPADAWEINAGASYSQSWDTFDSYDHDRIGYSISLTYLTL